MVVISSECQLPGMLSCIYILCRAETIQSLIHQINNIPKQYRLRSHAIQSRVRASFVSINVLQVRLSVSLCRHHRLCSQCNQHTSPKRLTLFVDSRLKAHLFRCSSHCVCLCPIIQFQLLSIHKNRLLCVSARACTLNVHKRSSKHTTHAHGDTHLFTRHDTQVRAHRQPNASGVCARALQLLSECARSVGTRHTAHGHTESDLFVTFA